MLLSLLRILMLPLHLSFSSEYLSCLLSHSQRSLNIHLLPEPPADHSIAGNASAMDWELDMAQRSSYRTDMVLEWITMFMFLMTNFYVNKNKAWLVHMK